jgi:hypothetical protein
MARKTKNLSEGNVYNVETANIMPNRSKELDSVNKIMMDQFWAAMERQGISKEKGKLIADTTFGYKSNT